MIEIVGLGKRYGDLKAVDGLNLSIGKGEMGSEPFKMIMNDTRFDDIPLILETPDDTIWAEEIKMLYGFIE